MLALFKVFAHSHDVTKKEGYKRSIAQEHQDFPEAPAVEHPQGEDLFPMEESKQVMPQLQEDFFNVAPKRKPEERKTEMP